MSGLQKMISWKKKILKHSYAEVFVKYSKFRFATQKISKKGMSSKNEIK